MITGSVTIGEVVEVFRALGGEGTRADFLRSLSVGRGYPSEPYAPYYKDRHNFESTAWQVVQQRCRGYEKHTGKNLLFENVGNGKCRLLEVNLMGARGPIPVSLSSASAFQFVAKAPSALSESALVQMVAKKRLMILEHNTMQRALYDLLKLEFGKNHVGCENFTCLGTRIDLVVKQDDKYRFYEIKTDLSPRVCLRQAIGQLLEYAFFGPGHPIRLS
jgi:hypothetical protein